MNTKVYLTLAILIWPLIGHATIPLEGYLIAEQNCPAFHSIKKSTNPGDITLTKGMAYAVTGKNKSNATHYLIEIEGTEVNRRWVETSCGKLLIDCKQKTLFKSKPAAQHTYLLAVSWQPAFCQTHQQKPECSSQTPERYDAKHFALHGLWPQPRGNAYCNVGSKEKAIDRNKHWHLLAPLNLSDQLFENLLVVMPGVASHLHRHEWIKHGTCYSHSPETYYKHSLLLMDQLNQSAVRDFMVDNIGKSVTTAAIRSQFDAAFGEGTGDKVNVRCKKGMIEELWINLQGEIDEETPMSTLLKAAQSAKASCDEGLVDPAGF